MFRMILGMLQTTKIITIPNSTVAFLASSRFTEIKKNEISKKFKMKFNSDAKVFLV